MRSALLVSLSLIVPTAFAVVDCVAGTYVSAFWFGHFVVSGAFFLVFCLLNNTHTHAHTYFSCSVAHPRVCGLHWLTLYLRKHPRDMLLRLPPELLLPWRKEGPARGRLPRWGDESRQLHLYQ